MHISSMWSFWRRWFAVCLIGFLVMGIIAPSANLTYAGPRITAGTSIVSEETLPAPLLPGTPLSTSASPSDVTIAAAQWIRSPIVTTDHVCADGRKGFINHRVGYFGEPGVSPRVGEPYYIEVAWNVASCQSLAGVQFSVSLPEGTRTAITAENKVRCFRTDYRVSPERSTELTGADCPQDVKKFWETQTGFGYNIWIPVVPTKSGIQQLVAQFTDVTAEGFEPSNAQVAVGVVAVPPAIRYPSPSASNITATSARLHAFVDNHYTAGHVYFDLGTSTSYGMSTQPYPISAESDWYELFTDEHDFPPLMSGTTYHWRLRFVAANGQTYAGPDQTFMTLSGTAPTLPNQRRVYLPFVVDTSG